MKGAIIYFRQDDDGGRARVTKDEEWAMRKHWTNRDEVMNAWRLGSCENFVGKWEALVFDAFSDSDLVERA